MKFVALSLMALGASAAPATYSQVHHTIGLGQTANIHKQVVATPVTTFNKIVEPLAYNKVQTFVQPSTFVKPAVQFVQPQVQYVQQPQVQYVQQPQIQYVQQPQIQTLVAPQVQTLVAPQVQAAQYRSHEVTLPVHQVDRTVQYLDSAHIEKPAEIQMVRIGSTSNPLHIHFDTQSSQLTTSQSHIPVPAAEPKFQEAQDDASFLKTDIKKPVIQSVTETVFPQREIKQHIAPLTETVNTVVSRATHDRAQYVAPQPVHHVQHQVQSFVKPVETVQTFVKPVETVQHFVKPIETVQTYVKPVETVQHFVKPVVQNFQTVVAKPVEYIQDQTVEYVHKPVHNVHNVHNVHSVVLKPTATIGGYAKDVVVEKAY